MIFEPIYSEIERRLAKEFGHDLDIHKEPLRVKSIKRLPALFVDMIALDPRPDPGTGEVEMTSRWEIRLLISAKQQGAKIVARDASFRICTLLNDKVLAKNTFPCRSLGCSDDKFDVNVPDYEMWLSEFEIVVRAGTDEWDTWEFYQENLCYDVYLDREFQKESGGQDV